VWLYAPGPIVASQEAIDWSVGSPVRRESLKNRHLAHISIAAYDSATASILAFGNAFLQSNAKFGRNSNRHEQMDQPAHVMLSNGIFEPFRQFACRLRN
jgi:hypothetical protein